MLAKHLDRIDFSNSFDPFYLLTDFGWPRALQEKINVNYIVTSDDQSLTLTVDLPGVKKSDLHVETSGQSITIKAKRGKEDFAATYKICKDYSIDQPDAHLEDGVLTLKFDRRSETKPRTITIR